MTDNIIVLIGPSMSGKTMLCQALKKTLKPDTVVLDEFWLSASADDIHNATIKISSPIIGAKGAIITAQSVAEARRRLEMLGINIDSALFIHLEATENYPVDADKAVMTIDYHLTKQAEPYTSIRAGVSLPVLVTPDDDFHAIFSDNLDAIKYRIQGEIDAEFEAVGKPASYSPERRGRLLVVGVDKLAAIIPEDVYEHMLPDPWRKIAPRMEHHRLEYVYDNARKIYPEYTIVDCSDGDLSALPVIEQVWLHVYRKMKLAVFCDAELPVALKTQAGDSWHWAKDRIGLPDGNRRWAASQSNEYELTLVDCTCGNFNPLREFYAEYVIAQDELEEDNDDDYKDDDDGEVE